MKSFESNEKNVVSSQMDGEPVKLQQNRSHGLEKGSFGDSPGGRVLGRGRSQVLSLLKKQSARKVKQTLTSLNTSTLIPLKEKCTFYLTKVTDYERVLDC